MPRRPPALYSADFTTIQMSFALWLADLLLIIMNQLHPVVRTWLCPPDTATVNPPLTSVSCAIIG